MFPFSRATRARIAAVMVVAITVLSVAVPLLDQGRNPGALAVSEPGEATGYVDHHHGVCMQHSAAAWSAAGGAELPSERLVHEVDRPTSTARSMGLAGRSLHHSRAPPNV